MMDSVSLMSKIELARLEIEHLKLENERLRLLNENMILRSRSQDRVDSIVMDNIIETNSQTILLPVEEENMLVNDSKNEEDNVKINDVEDEEEEVDEVTKNILMYNFTYSTIKSCSINKTQVTENELNYTRIARKIWELTPRQIIYDSSTFNSKDYYCSKHGFKWIYEIQLSMQIGNTKDIVNEIIHMCKLMNYDLKLSVQLESGYEINIRVFKGKNHTKSEVVYKVEEFKQVLKADKMLYSKYYGW
jgi:hypothetical protein